MAGCGDKNQRPRKRLKNNCFIGVFHVVVKAGLEWAAGPSAPNPIRPGPASGVENAGWRAKIF